MTAFIPQMLFPNMMPLGAAQNLQLFNRMPIAPALYVGNLDENIHEEALFDTFSKFGPVNFVRIVRDNASQKSRGFGYVNFMNARDADLALNMANNMKIGRYNIRVMYKTNVKNFNQDANVYVKNL